MSRRAVIDLNSPRPAWRVPEFTLAAVRRALGSGWEVEVVQSEASSDGDGGAGSAEAERYAVGAEIFVGWGIAAGVAAAGAGSLRWVHTAAAGVGASLTPELRASGAIFTNSRGVQSEPMADWVVAAIGYCLRGFHFAVAAQKCQDWTKDAFTDGTVAVREFMGTRVGIVGLGGVGQAVAKRCVSLGMVVRGTRRDPSRSCVDGVEWIGRPEDLLELARESDILVVAAPSTRSTAQVVNRGVLRELPCGAFVVNVARGALVNEADLLSGLDDGHIAGCVLDVFEDEPLPEDHPFWRHDGVLVTPHVSSVSDRFWERQTNLLIDNIGRYVRGEGLQNIVDFEMGY